MPIAGKGKEEKKYTSQVKTMHCTVTGANGESRAQPHRAASKNTPMSLYDQRGCFGSFMKI